MMKLRVRFKDPDLIHNYICGEFPMPKNATEAQEAAVDKKRESLCDKLFQYGDYGCIELDTVTGTGRLVPVKQWR